MRLMTILALIVNMLLAPLKGKQKELQDGQVRFEAELKDLQKGPARLESRIDKIEMLLSAQIPNGLGRR